MDRKIIITYQDGTYSTVNTIKEAEEDILQHFSDSDGMTPDWVRYADTEETLYCNWSVKVERL